MILMELRREGKRIVILSEAKDIGVSYLTPFSSPSPPAERGIGGKVKSIPLTPFLYKELVLSLSKERGE